MIEKLRSEEQINSRNMEKLKLKIKKQTPRAYQKKTTIFQKLSGSIKSHPKKLITRIRNGFKKK